ncbi:histone deacetylase family protein [Enterovirga aerilata]|uniref:Histone deacetylase family protein n=1 Tax=Enterovirga aerilata TaxID=2730920 RepID=A0A849IFF0_9HYPH|nr:histone deacetylase family protein [Enterovirga sp. DB1703]NNM74860.1 histone deacetylase family protein [Enterovirga sp. DB1703]
MTTLLLHHPAVLEHRTPTGHPERPDRIRAVERALAAEEFSTLERRLAERAGIDTIALAHPRAYVEAIEKAAPEEGLVGIDSDTVMSPGTLEAIQRGVGAAVQAVDAVMTGAAANAFSAMRPPGHHAERTRAMGFCFYNNAAVAARHAQTKHGAERVAIVDWDVHHGNGSQDIFWSDQTVLYASTHQMPLYPGTGALSERGDFDTIVNAPLRPGADGETFREAFDTRIMPRLEDFAPDLVIISAGFDAHWRDPLANLRLEAEDFAWATRRLMDLAARRCGGRVVSLLEGGYDLQGLSDSVAAHVRTLMEA